MVDQQEMEELNILTVWMRHTMVTQHCFCGHQYPFRDWSLIMGRGGATKGEGRGAREVLPLQKGGVEKVLAMLKGGGAQKVLG